MLLDIPTDVLLEIQHATRSRLHKMRAKLRAETDPGRASSHQRHIERLVWFLDHTPDFRKGGKRHG